MTLTSIWAVISRWRWIVIPGILLALAGGAAAFWYTPYTQTVEARYLFLSPVVDTKGVAGNPFLQLGNGVAQAVDILAVSLTDGETERKYTEDAPTLEYGATRDRAITAPLMVITVTYTDPEVAYDTLDSLGDDMTRRLVVLQQDAGAPRSQWVTITPISRDPEPELGFEDPIRNAVIAFGGVMVSLLAIVALADRRRSTRDGLVPMARRDRTPRGQSR